MLFILDGKIGEYTQNEIETAVTCARKKRHPLVFIYGKNFTNDNKRLEYFMKNGIYYQHYGDNVHLSKLIEGDLSTAAEDIDPSCTIQKWLISALLAMLLLGGMLLFSIISKQNMLFRGSFNEGKNEAQLYWDSNKWKCEFVNDSGKKVTMYLPNNVIIDSIYSYKNEDLTEKRGVWKGVIKVSETITFKGNCFNSKGDSVKFEFNLP